MLRLIVLLAMFVAVFALVIWTGYGLINTIRKENFDEEYTREN